MVSTGESRNVGLYKVLVKKPLVKYFFEYRQRDVKILLKCMLNTTVGEN
jgi:hypothetical protein